MVGSDTAATVDIAAVVMDLLQAFQQIRITDDDATAAVHPHVGELALLIHHQGSQRSHCWLLVHESATERI